jgi:zinc protease
VADSRIADLGIRKVRFANNVRLNIKKTDFEKGSVRYSVRIAGGILALPEDRPGLGVMISSLSAMAGLEKHSIEDLRQILAGRSVQSGLGVGEDAFGTEGVTASKDLPLQMQLTAAFITAPGYRREAATRWASLLPIMEGQRRATAQAVASYEVPGIIANGDSRFGVPETPVLAKRSLDEMRSVLQPLFASAPIEIGLVGDVDEADAIAAVARTFGALTTRAAEAPAYSEQRKAKLRSDPTPVTLTHTGPEDQALLMNIWPATDDDDYPLLVKFDLLSDVLGLMLTDKLREELGETYSPNVSVSASDVFDDYGYFSVGATIDPAKIGAVEEAIAETVAKLRDKPVDADLIARARNPSLERIDRSLRENGYWLDRVAVAQSEPERLDRIRQRRQLYLAVTPAGLQQLAQRYLAADRKLSIRIVSDKAKLAQR